MAITGHKTLAEVELSLPKTLSVGSPPETNQNMIAE